jgi:hypothetical protein
MSAVVLPFEACRSCRDLRRRHPRASDRRIRQLHVILHER